MCRQRAGVWVLTIVQLNDELVAIPPVVGMGEEHDLLVVQEWRVLHLQEERLPAQTNEGLNPWQLIILRFLMGLAIGGLNPSVNALVKTITPDSLAGRIFGLNVSAQYLGVFGDAILGGQVAAYLGIRYVFFVMSAVLLINGVWVYRRVYRKLGLNPASRTSLDCSLRSSTTSQRVLRAFLIGGGNRFLPKGASLKRRKRHRNSRRFQNGSETVIVIRMEEMATFRMT